jgi:L-histidine N-alpha-methyltransferase
MKIVNLIEDRNKLDELRSSEFAREIVNGLNSKPKKLSSMYFYDDRGSQIFQQITKLDDYYLTRKEIEIFETYKNELPDIVGKDEVDIVELGVGDGHKTKILIESFLNKKIKVNFFPIDISPEALNQLEKNLAEFPELNVEAVAADYLEGLKYVRSHSDRRQIVLFLGSNIGNFSREAEYSFLKEIKGHMRSDDFLLIGFDLKKDIDVLTKAYSDSEGITAEFNLNLLDRLNEEFDADFKRENFKHLALYNPVLGAMESFLISLVGQTVSLKKLNKIFSFDEFEPIHTEYSFKFTEKEIKELSRETGFNHVSNFSDRQHYYVDSLWQV